MLTGAACRRTPPPGEMVAGLRGGLPPPPASWEWGDGQDTARAEIVDCGATWRDFFRHSWPRQAVRRFRSAFNPAAPLVALAEKELVLRCFAARQRVALDQPESAGLLHDLKVGSNRPGRAGDVRREGAHREVHWLVAAHPGHPSDDREQARVEGQVGVMVLWLQRDAIGKPDRVQDRRLTRDAPHFAP
jgi:hypothetical protein